MTKRLNAMKCEDLSENLSGNAPKCMQRDLQGIFVSNSDLVVSESLRVCNVRCFKELNKRNAVVE